MSEKVKKSSMLDLTIILNYTHKITELCKYSRAFTKHAMQVVAIANL